MRPVCAHITSKLRWRLALLAAISWCWACCCHRAHGRRGGAAERDRPRRRPPPRLLPRLLPPGPALAGDVNALPSPSTDSVGALLAAFNSAADLVALSGAHTVGRAGCGFFSDRAARRDDTFSRKLAANCSKQGPEPVAEPGRADAGRVRQRLLRRPRTAEVVKKFAKSQDAFFAQFAKSMVKLCKVPRKPAGNVGEIRRSCFSTNAQTQSILESDVDEVAGAEALAA
ncbi:hypothetical protein ACP4OV_025966 [Aristida adscensionis]